MCVILCYTFYRVKTFPARKTCNKYMSSKDVSEMNMSSARRKNGHKMSCTCHICENMAKKNSRGGYQEDIQKETLKRSGGSGKKNGHKPDCRCPICVNMSGSRSRSRSASASAAGGCGCKSGGKRRTASKSPSKKLLQRETSHHCPDCDCKLCKELRAKLSMSGGGDDASSTPMPSDTSAPSTPMPTTPTTPASSDAESTTSGGSRRRHRHRSHRRHRKTHRRRR